MLRITNFTTVGDLDKTPLRSYIFVCILAIAGQTVGPNGVKFV